jgi:uncharacterized protein (TIGR03790 family)
VLVGVVVALLAPRAVALQPDELLLLANRNDTTSMELAQFYATARQVPEGRILGLDLSGNEDISFDDYEMKVVPGVRAFLREQGLHNRVRCIVAFYGTPLRISGKQTSDAERTEVAAIKKELEEARKSLPPVVEALEALAAEVNPKFAPDGGRGNGAADALDQMGRRVDNAMRTIGSGLRNRPQKEQLDMLVRLGRIVLDFSGPAKLSEMFQGGLPPGLEPPRKDSDWRGAADRARGRIEYLQERRYDADCRAQIREAIRDSFGAFGLAHLLQAQIDYLENDGTAASFDNELALLWWGFYPRSRWQVNHLHYRVKGVRTQPVIMTIRLDAPRPEMVREMITDGIQAEKAGLRGRVVIDSRGIELKPGDGYSVYDESLRRLNKLLAEKTKMRVLFDDRPDVIKQHTAPDTALYCGWYKLRSYVPSCGFNPGAVGFHVASLEMVSLHAQGESGWVAGLLRNNVAATLGAVAEPYLSAFPNADDFFPLLLTGQLPLAEVYWRTNPMTSWMIGMVGDPLYTPYKVNPQLKAEDLPEPLRNALDPMPRVPIPTTRPTTAPATRPATRP